MYRSVILTATILLLAISGRVTGQGVEPTDAHKVLEHEVGTWHAQGKMWMPGSAEATEFEGIETNRMVGGMWVVSDFEGEFSGQAFTGHGLTGFDLDNNKYMGIWVDSMSPYATKLKGSYDAGKKTLSMITMGKDPATRTDYEGRNDVHYKDDNTRIMTMWNKVGGEMVKSMEIVYTRKNGG